MTTRNITRLTIINKPIAILSTIKVIFYVIIDKFVQAKGFSEMENGKLPEFKEYAIFETGGKQYQAIPGKTLAIEKIEGESGTEIIFDKVYFRKTEGSNYEVGQPIVDGSVIKATIVKQTKAPKVIIFKFKRRKKYRVKKGHRQPQTVVRFESI